MAKRTSLIAEVTITKYRSFYEFILLLRKLSEAIIFNKTSDLGLDDHVPCICWEKLNSTSVISVEYPVFV